MNLETLVNAATYIEQCEYFKLCSSENYQPPPNLIIEEVGEVTFQIQEQTVDITAPKDALKPWPDRAPVPEHPAGASPSVTGQKGMDVLRGKRKAEEKFRRNTMRSCFKKLDQVLPVAQNRSDQDILHAAITEIRLLQKEYDETSATLKRCTATNLNLQRKLLRMQSQAASHPMKDHTGYFRGGQTHKNPIETVNLCGDENSAPKSSVQINSGDKNLITLPMRPGNLLRIGAFGKATIALPVKKFPRGQDACPKHCKINVWRPGSQAVLKSPVQQLTNVQPLNLTSTVPRRHS